MKKACFLPFILVIFGIGLSIFVLPKKVYALNCSSCASIVDNSWCSGAGQVTCTGPNAPAWTRAETKCCKGEETPCDPYLYQYLGICYKTYTYYSCTSDCYNQDCCSGGNVIAGHCETSLGANPACWFGNKYKVCCRPDGTEVPCSKTGNCPSQYNQQLCPAGSTITAPGVTTCAVVSTPTPIPTPPPGVTPPPGATQPPTCNNCPAKTWCAPNATECSNAGGYVLSNPCPYCSSGTVHCCTPEGGDDDDDCEGQFRISGPANVCIEDGADFTVRQHQESKHPWIPVTINQPGGTILPPDIIACQAGDFNKNPEGKDLSCRWDTMHIEEAVNYSDFNQNLPTWYPKPPGPYPIPPNQYKVSAVYYPDTGDCKAQTVSMYTNLIRCILPCPTSLSAVCNANGTATFSWSAVTGAVSYTLRVDKAPYAPAAWTPVFVSPLFPSDGKGDFTANPAGLSVINPLETGVWWEWSIHPIRAGEAYFAWQPNVCYAPHLLCPVILPTSTPTPTPIPKPNCKNVSGPGTIVAGGSASYQATYENASGPVDRIGLYSYLPGGATCFSGGLNWSQAYGPGTYSTNWTPSAEGNYKVCCRAWNDEIAECRGMCLDGAYQYLCAGPNACQDVWVSVPSWFQTTGGDIQAQDDITSLIPACATTSRYLSQNGEGGTSGVVGYGASDGLKIGDRGRISESSWKVNTRYAVRNTGFEYLANRLRVNRTDNLGIGDIDISSLTDGVYYSSESLEFRNIVGSFPDGKKIVIFIDGTADIRSNLVVPVGSFLAIIASGDLTFSSAVIQAQGFFLADGTLEINESSEQFIGQGSFVGLDLEGSGGISLLRDLGNNCNPAEAFVERPDFFINAPDEFKLTNSYFKEIEP